MGFSSLLDILGSTMIGALLLLILFRMNDVATENTFTHAAELQVQEGLVETITVLEHDFRKMGYCSDWTKIPIPTRAIIRADTNDITFLTDVKESASISDVGDGDVDTIHYYAGETSELPGTRNPYDFPLYRVVNGKNPRGANIGLTTFRLRYYDVDGKELSTPISLPQTGAIHTIQIDIEIQNTAAYDDKYSSVFWRQIRLAAKNLQNR
ncbi:MAG: hypothetical protein PHW27_07980 [Melioribacteraceae bacterium]|nr:hypothetical protein [Melioribacteraceae bacterium]MDD3558501.1 hypothetical protein [Melioribacteraceae bacterium]